MSLSSRQCGVVFLWLGTILLASTNSVVAKLGQISAEHIVNGLHPLSFCNVLFVSSLCAGLVMVGLTYRSWRWSTLRQVSLKDWALLVLIALLGSTLSPALFYFAVMLTEVINVVLITTLQIPITFLIGRVFYKEKPGKLTIIGASLTVLGIIIIFLFAPASLTGTAAGRALDIRPLFMAEMLSNIPKVGELCALFGTLFAVCSMQGCRAMLHRVPHGIVVGSRLLIGATLFFILAIVFFGWGHFEAITSPFLWRWMFLYGAVIIAGGFYLTYKGVALVLEADLAIAKAFTPVGGMFFAYLILGEIPHLSQFAGAVVIIVGIVLALIETIITERKAKLPRPPIHPPDNVVSN